MPLARARASHLTPEQLETLRRVLQTAAAEKRGLLVELAEGEENEPLVVTTRDGLADLDRALTRIDQGTYGTCESCESPIPFERLEAVPEARFCIGCPRPRGVFG